MQRRLSVLVLLLLFLSSICLGITPTDRNVLLKRNNPIVQSFDSLATLSIGNGEFAMSVDPTGLQTFLCGHFSPAMPYSLQDLWNMGVKLDEDRLTRPYLRAHFLGEVFGYDTEFVKQNFLLTNDGNIYYFPEHLDTQRKVQQYFLDPEHRAALEGKCNIDNVLNGLLYLHCEILFVRDQKNPSMLHPRIAMYQSHNFSELYADQRQLLMDIHNDYFYHRHTAFWRDSAMKKLPTLIAATDMLCCGEDLGMVPTCVPEVMSQLEILSLEIQRMPKDPTRAFAHPADAPYLSVCTIGTHDMNPMRAWWEEAELFALSSS